MNPHPLDIPDFLKRDKNEPRPVHSGPSTNARERHVKRPPGWHALTKSEQEGTADPVTIALRKQLEADRKAKQAERFEALKALPKKPRLPRAARKFTGRGAVHVKKEKKAERYGVVTEGDLVAFSIDAKSSSDARAVLKALRKAGKTPKVKVTSLRKLRPDDKGVGGKAIQHIA